MFNRFTFEVAVIGKRITAVVWDEQKDSDYGIELDAIEALVLNDGSRISMRGSAEIDDARAYVAIEGGREPAPLGDDEADAQRRADFFASRK